MNWSLKCQTCKHAVCHGYGLACACDKDECQYEPYKTAATSTGCYPLQETITSTEASGSRMYTWSNSAVNAIEPKISPDEKAKQRIQQLQDSLNDVLNSLATIWDLGHDYDGFNTVGGLKSLIDDICDIAKEGIQKAKITDKET